MKLVCLLFCSLAITIVSVAQSHFSVSSTEGCSPLEISFSSNNHSNGFSAYPWIPIYGCDYYWDFGNGTISFDENPLSVFYEEPGIYNVYYEAIIDTIGFVLSDVTILSVNCTDFGMFGAGDPDVFFDLYDASSNIAYHSGHESDQLPPLNFTNLNISLNNPPYSIAVMDSDSDGDDNCINDSEHNIAIPIHLPGIDQEGPITQTVSQGGLSFEYTIYKTIQRYSDSVEIHVYETPNVGELSTISEQNVICDGEPVFIQAPFNENYNYTWFNDTEMISSSSNSCEVSLAGNYYALVYDIETGLCFDYSDTITITEGSLPQEFDVSGLEDSVYYLHSTFLSAQLYRWHRNNLLIYESSNYNLYSPVPGDYFVEIITQEGCRDTSNTIVFLPTKVDVQKTSTYELYPNPVSDILFVKCPKSDILLAEVLDISGKQFFLKEYSNLKQGEIVKIPVSQLKKGIYLIRLSENSQITNYKFVKTLQK